MVALAEKYTRESYTPRNRTARNFRRPKNGYRDFFLRPQNRGPATKNRVLSAKYLDDTLEWYYYGYRYYSPELGRWVNRDPIGEQGGENLFGFVGNEPLTRIDALGDEITSLEIKHSGTPLLSASEYQLMVVEYFATLVSGDLGFHERWHPGFTESVPDGWGGTRLENHPAARAALFKFEYVAKNTCLLREYRDRGDAGIRLTHWILNDSGLWRRKRGSGGAWSLAPDWPISSYPHYDGPSLQREVSRSGGPGGTVVTTYAGGDALRYFVPNKRPEKKYEYWLKVRWKVRAEDSDNAWEGEHLVNIFMDIDSARGGARVTRAPAPVVGP